jgi:hypothetical protein
MSRRWTKADSRAVGMWNKVEEGSMSALFGGNNYSSFGLFVAKKAAHGAHSICPFSQQKLINPAQNSSQQLPFLIMRPFTDPMKGNFW